MNTEDMKLENPTPIEVSYTLEAREPKGWEKIMMLKGQLSASDYKAIKYAEGLISEEDYAPIKAERQKIREEINRLEAEAVTPSYSTE